MAGIFLQNFMPTKELAEMFTENDIKMHLRLFKAIDKDKVYSYI